MAPATGPWRKASRSCGASTISTPAIAACGLSPLRREVHDFIQRYRRVYVVDQNRDAQMLSLLRLESSGEEIAKLRSVRHYDGLPLDARTVTDAIASQEVAN